MSVSDNQDLVVRIGGDSAKGGIVLTGETLARIAALSGLEVYTTRTIPAEIKGGHVMIQVRAAPYPVTSQGDDLDILLAYDQETYDRYYTLLKPGAVLVYNSNELQPPADSRSFTTACRWTRSPRASASPAAGTSWPSARW